MPKRKILSRKASREINAEPNSYIVFESPVAWTEKRLATEPDPTTVRFMLQLQRRWSWTGQVASCII